MNVAAVIPARMGSSRYPGKPLCDIHGMSMIEHVHRRTVESDLVNETYIATPDQEIWDEVCSFGGSPIMTGSHSRATDRVAEAAEELNAKIIVVVQGDEPLIYPEMIDDVVQPLLDDTEILVATMANEVRSDDIYRDPNFAKIVVDKTSNALYFSREPIPNLHDTDFDEMPIYKHVALIPFRREFLFEFADMSETPLEQAESIDLLRALENGYDVRIVETDRYTVQVDTPEDHERVNELIVEDNLFEKYAESQP